MNDIKVVQRFVDLVLSEKQKRALGEAPKALFVE
jgi:hypothetical protein